MKKKWTGILLTSLTAVMALTACGGNGTAPAAQQEKNAATESKPVVIKIAHQVANDSQLGRTVMKFKEVVESKSKGQITVEVYPSGQLYGEKDIPEALTNGSLQMGMASTSVWGGFVPASEIFDVPFLFTNYDQAHQAIDGEIGKSVGAEMEKVGAMPLFWPDYGFINFTNSSKPAAKPEDFKGMKIRVIGEMSAKTVEGFGAAPVFMGGNEVYMALQRKTVDAAASGLSSFADRKYYEVQKYLTINNAGLVQFMGAINLDFYNSLSPEQQQILQEAGKEATEYSRSAVKEDDKKAVETLKANMEVTEVTDYEPWKAATKGSQDLYAQKAGDIGKKLLELAKTIK